MNFPAMFACPIILGVSAFRIFSAYRYPSQIFESVLDIAVLPLMLVLSRYELGAARVPGYGLPVTELLVRWQKYGVHRIFTLGRLRAANCLRFP